jgi:hypothetical protein
MRANGDGEAALDKESYGKQCLTVSTRRGRAKLRLGAVTTSASPGCLNQLVVSGSFSVQERDRGISVITRAAACIPGARTADYEVHLEQASFRVWFLDASATRSHHRGCPNHERCGFGNNRWRERPWTSGRSCARSSSSRSNSRFVSPLHRRRRIQSPRPSKSRWHHERAVGTGRYPADPSLARLESGENARRQRLAGLVDGGRGPNRLATR